MGEALTESKYHRIVLATKRDLERQRPDGYSLLDSHASGTMKVRVSPNSLQRALEILQSVVTGAEARGWSVEGKTEEHAPGIRIGKQLIHFSITEESKGAKPTWEDKIAGRRRRYVTTGRLKLAFECWTDPPVDQKSWSDGSTQKVEEFISYFLDNVGVGADRIRQREAKWERECRKRERLALLAAEEKNRRTEVFEQAACWRQTTDLRAMIEQLRRECTGEAPRWSADRAQRWIEWAEALVNRNDPFLNGYFDRVLKVKRFYPEMNVSDQQGTYW